MKGSKLIFFILILAVLLAACDTGSPKETSDGKSEAITTADTHTSTVTTEDTNDPTSADTQDETTENEIAADNAETDETTSESSKTGTKEETESHTLYDKTEETDSETMTETNVHIHSFGDWSVTQSATCTSDGTRERLCVCGEKETQSIDAIDHTTVTDAAISATCKDTGLTEGSHCSACGEVFVAQTVIPVTDIHTPVTDAAISATCKDTGLTEGSHCSVCNKVLIAQTTTSTLEHDMTNATCILPATCKRKCGYTEGTVSKHVIDNGICTICEAKTISTVEELKNIALDGKYILVNDLSLENEEWTPLGTNTEPFSGYFDGNGYTISNLKITSQYYYFGLFGYNTGSIRNLGIETISFSGYVRLTGSIYAGGLVGYNSGTIMNCYTNEVNIWLHHFPDVSVATGFVGGLSGYNRGEILCSYSSGTQVSMAAMSTLSATYAYAGGLVGCNKNGTISDCYSAIKKVSGSYNGSNMNCASHVGGLVGTNNSGTIANCYRDGSQTFYSTISATATYKSTNDEGTFVEASELKTVMFHTDTLGWSTEDWVFNEGSLPSLKKEARVSAE